MARPKLFIAILLALVFAFSPTTDLLADGPGIYNPNGNTPADGHPWDDQVVETNPGGGGDSGTASQTAMPNMPSIDIPCAAIGNSGASFVALVFRNVMDQMTRISEIKTTKSKVVRRLR